jgi:hypothetical protein
MPEAEATEINRTPSTLTTRADSYLDKSKSPGLILQKHKHWSLPLLRLLISRLNFGNQFVIACKYQEIAVDAGVIVALANACKVVVLLQKGIIATDITYYLCCSSASRSFSSCHFMTLVTCYFSLLSSDSLLGGFL